MLNDGKHIVPKLAKFSLAQLNVQSLTNKKSLLEVFVEGKQPDVLSIAEHWCTEDSMKMFSLEGYTLSSWYCRPTRQHGGVCLLVRELEDVAIKRISVEQFCVEMVIECCAVLLSRGDFACCIVSVYRPDNDIEEFFLRFAELLRYCYGVSANLILCGDLNVNYLRDSSYQRTLTDIFVSFGLRCTNLEPTRIFLNKNGVLSKTKIDYVCTNIVNDCDTCVIQGNIADHLVLLFKCTYEIDSSCDCVEGRTQLYRFSDRNLRELCSFLDDSMFSDVYGRPHDTEGMFGAFMEVLTWAVDVCCPVSTGIVPKNFSKCAKPWINFEIRHRSHQLKNIFWLYKNTRDITVLNDYKNKKRELKKLVDDTKRKYYCARIRNSANKSKTIWDVVNREICRKKSDGKIISAIKVDGVIIREPQDIANVFVRYITEVVDDSLLQHYNRDLSTECTVVPSVCNSFFYTSVTTNDILHIISRLKTRVSTGIDGMSAKLIKTIAAKIARPLAFMVNSSLGNGQFPGQLKMAAVALIFKNKGDPLMMENYRPISVLNIISKIFEMAVQDKLISYINNFNIMSVSQHGFTRGRSTETAAYEFADFLYRELDDGNCVGAVFFDLSRAFDCVDLDFMESKLYAQGIRGSMLKWLVSYLDKRKLCVRLQNVTSPYHELNRGVPQGSVLGPLLFNLYTNDLLSFFTRELNFKFQLVNYADDTTVAVSSQTPEELRRNVDATVAAFNRWCRLNNLILNLTKTCYVSFQLARPISSVVMPPGAGIAECNEAKFLGLTVDRDLKFVKHIDELCGKLNGSYFAILNLKGVLNDEGMKAVYYALVHSRLAYGVCLWGGSPHSARVFKTQKKIIRLIYNLKFRESCRNTFRSQKILTLPSVYMYNCILYTKKNIHRFPRNSNFHSYSTRNAEELISVEHRTSKYEASLSYSGVRLYNRLPVEVKKEGLLMFQKKLRDLMINGAYYSVEEYMQDGVL